MSLTSSNVLALSFRFMRTFAPFLALFALPFLKSSMLLLGDSALGTLQVR